ISEWLDSVGNPYPVSSPSLETATARLEDDRGDIAGYIDRVGREREELEALLADYGVEVTDSRANFVFGRFEDAAWVQDALAGMGFAVRAFPDDTELADALRITCPGDPEVSEKLVDALHTIFDPEALFLDMDGVLADVSDSYRQAIVQTAAHFGLELTDDDVSEAKSAGDANNDWILTQRLLAEADIEIDYDDVKAVYEARYQGEGDHRGLWRRESLIHEIERLRTLAERLPLGIVTGRPRRDADRFFEHTGLDEVVEAVVCMEDAPRKPAPEPVELLADRMGVERGWMIGDTPDDAKAARAYGALPLGTIGPGEDPATMRPALIEAGCARIIEDFDELEALLAASCRR
ncbi:MAG: TIGR01548 family HAD-type hydrolase, partial [Bradymonadaceae bacterium]